MKRITRFTLADLLTAMDDGAYIVAQEDKRTLYNRSGEYLREVSALIVTDAVKRNAIRGHNWAGNQIVYSRVTRPAVIKQYSRR